MTAAPHHDLANPTPVDGSDSTRRHDDLSNDDLGDDRSADSDSPVADQPRQHPVPHGTWPIRYPSASALADGGWAGWLDASDVYARHHLTGDTPGLLRGLSSLLRKGEWWQFARDDDPVRKVEQKMRAFNPARHTPEQAAGVLAEFDKMCADERWYIFRG